MKIVEIWVCNHCQYITNYSAGFSRCSITEERLPQADGFTMYIDIPDDCPLPDADENFPKFERRC